MTTKFQSITSNLMVEDVDKSVDYYKKTLGFTLEISVPKDDGKLQWAMVSRDAVDLMLHERDNILEEMPELKGTEPGCGAITLFIKMEGIDTFYEELRKKKEVTILREPHTTFYGMKEFILRDINGYIITFAEPVEQ